MQAENPDKQYLQLAEKWMNGTITPEEEKVFAQWYNENQDQEIIIPGAFVSGEEAHGQRIWQEIRQRQTLQQQTSQRQALRRQALSRLRLRRWAPRIAASVLLILLSGGAIWWFYGRSPIKQPVTASIASQVIRPIGDRARLTLADGSTVNLDDVKDGLITEDGKTKIDKQRAQLVYKTPALPKASPVVSYNTLTTPRGGMYAVTLSDGTRVWLNASSSLRYPTVFSGDVREVDLTGEAYFEVARNPSQPFRVLVNGMAVNVLGTHFNVMAYDDEPAIATTLLEGAVKVDYQGHSTALAPGQQSLLARAGGNVQVKEVDVDETVAWKNGVFQFRSEDIKSVMRKIARWYDVDVRYVGEIEDHFTGAVHRDANVSTLLSDMELTHKVHFHIVGRTILVSP